MNLNQDLPKMLVGDQVAYDMRFLVRTATESEARPLLIGSRKMAWRASSNDLEIPGEEKSRFYFLRLSFSRKKLLNVTPSSKVDFGDVSVSEGSSTAAEQLKRKEKQIDDVTGKFRYDSFGYLCMVYLCVTLFK